MLPFMAISAVKNLPWKWIGVGLAAVFILGIIGVSYWHYNGLLSTVNELEAANITLTLQSAVQDKHIVAQQSALAEWQANQIRMQKRIDAAMEESRKARKNTERLHELFSKHNLTKLAQKKPGLIQARINHGTDAVNRLLECITASNTDCSGDSKASGKTDGP